jgi:hypothetical protein
MAAHMKTKIEINDALLMRAKRLTAERQPILKSILETAIRQFLARIRHLRLPLGSGSIPFKGVDYSHILWKATGPRYGSKFMRVEGDDLRNIGPLPVLAGN